MGIGFTFLHPGVGHHDAVSITALISERSGEDTVVQVERALLQHGFAAHDRIEHMGVGVRASYLHIDRFSIGGEVGAGDIEPVVGFLAGSLVVEAEHHEVALDGVVAADGGEQVFARSERIRVKSNGHHLVGRCGIRLGAVVDIISHHAVDIGAGHVLVVEADGFQTVAFCPLGQVAGQHCAARAERQ